MSKVTTDNTNYSAIASAIREKLGVQTTYKPGDMADAIASIPTGGGCVHALAVNSLALPSSAVSSSAEASLIE